MADTDSEARPPEDEEPIVERKDSSKKKDKRNLAGTPATKCFAWPSDTKFQEMDGQFATQEYIQQLIRTDPSDIATICTLPTGQDKSVWVMEHLRIVLSSLNMLVVALSDECTAESCPLMVATKDWEFLCAAHPKTPRKCSAIDYTMHTLSGFNALLNSDEFPSRVRVSAKATKYFASIARRLYRLFAHPYYHHRAIFDQFEAETHLCKRFLHFATIYQLMTRQELTPPIALTS